MKKVIRLNENDIEKLVKKIIKENEPAEDMEGEELYPSYDSKGNFLGMQKPAGDMEDHMDEYESNTYMFWQNLETMKEAIEHMLEMDKDEVNQLLADGHAWALDHIATSADDVEEVYHFLDNRQGEMEHEYEAYHESKLFKGRLIESDEFGSVELIKEGSSACENRGLGKPWLTPDGPKKRSVCVKNASGNVVKVNFGDPNMRIKKSNPERRKSFRARHKCDNPGPRWKARYWSCKFW